jgi:hypothetical protein
MTTTAPIIRRPRYESAKLSEALRADWRGCHLSQKLDGVWSVKSFADGIYTGEAMRGGSFFVHTLSQGPASPAVNPLAHFKRPPNPEALARINEFYPKPSKKKAAN